jgi:DNA-3-methyladenine glycosylase II
MTVRKPLPGRAVKRDRGSVRASEVRWENEGGALESDEASDLARRDFPIDLEPPFRLDFSVWALRRRAGNTVDRWDGTTYRRALALNGGPVGFSITRAGRREARTLLVALSGRPTSLPVRDDVQASIERMLGLHVDLSGFYGMAEADDLVAPLAARFRGLKPPRFPTVFESLVNAVACQQLSLEAGLSLLNRLSAAHGETVSRDAASLQAFPRPEDSPASSARRFASSGSACERPPPSSNSPGR